MVIRRRYRHKRREEKSTVKRLRKNEEISAPVITLVDENGGNFLNTPIAEAIRRAQAAELDLVEVSPKAQPPVCRIMDYGKYLYRLEKTERKNRAKQKKMDTKGIRLTLKMADHDLFVRAKQANAFLMRGNKIKVELILRGREHAHQDLAHENIEQFKRLLEHAFVVEEPVKREGNRLSTILMPTK